MKSKFVSIKGLKEETGLPIRTLRGFMAARKIPYVKCGHRTVFFDADKVRAALEKFEVKAVA